MNDLLTRLSLRIGELRREEDGATAVEYGLIVGLIAVGIIAAVALLGGTIAGWFNDINAEITQATNPPSGG